MKLKADVRNIGGKQILMDQMTDHYSKLNSMKPTINTRTPPHPHINKLSKHSNKGGKLLIPEVNKKWEFNEVLTGFQKVNKVKSYVDTKQPHTLTMAQKLSQSKQRKKGAVFDPHLINLQHMARRINSIGSLQERKKNHWDPITHPSYFFRKEEDYKWNDPTIDGYTKKILKKQSQEKLQIKKLEIQAQQRPQSAKSQQQERTQTSVQSKRPQTSTKQVNFRPLVTDYLKQKVTADLKKINQQKQTNRPETPVSHSEQPYDEIKSKMIDFIVTFQIINAEELKDLGLRIINKNNHLDQDLVQQAVQEVLTGFDVQL